MTWYYVLDNERQGPVEQGEFEGLVRQRVIERGTQVWHEGMADWQPYREIAPVEPAALPAPVTAPPLGKVFCAECGQVFGTEQVIRLGNQYYCAACKLIATQKLKEGVLGDQGAVQIRKEHLRHEASVKSVGLLYYIVASFLLLVVVGFVAEITRQPQTAKDTWAAGVGFGIAVAQIWVGIGLRRLRAWARVPSGWLSVLGLLAFPFGTVINAYILCLLFSKKGKMVFSEEYKRIIEETPHLKYSASIIIWLLFGILLVLLGATILGSFFLTLL